MSSALSKAIAVLFAIVLNQGVVYYILYFSLGITPFGPLPVALAIMVCYLVALSVAPIAANLIGLLVASTALNFFYVGTYLYSPQGYYGWEKAIQTLALPPFCIVAGFLVARSGNLRMLLGTCAVLAVVAAAVYTTNQHTPELFAEGERHGSTVYHPMIITYHNFNFAIALGAIWALDQIPGRTCSRSALLYIFVLGCVYYLGQTGGRLGILVLFVATLAFVWSRARNRAFVVGAMLVLLVGLGVIGSFVSEHAAELATDPQTPFTIRRMITYLFLEHSRAHTRDTLYALAFDVFLRFPLAGTGWGGFPIAASLPDVSGWHPHNLLLELLAETGLVGTAIFLLCLGCLIYIFANRVPRGPDKDLLAVLFIVGFFTSMVGGDWPQQRTLWFSAGALAALSSIRRPAKADREADALPRSADRTP